MAGSPAPDEVITAAASIGVDLATAQVGRLQAYVSVLEERAVPLGLVARSDAGRLWERHVLDCLRAAPFLAHAGTAYDLGSGAGLPGVVLAVALPACRVTLVESTSRKAGFLEMAIERLGLENASVAVARAEDLEDAADGATARAFAPLERSWKVAVPLLRRGGRLVYFAGEGLEEPERAAARADDPEPPAAVEIARGLATASPLVIMTRG